MNIGFREQLTSESVAKVSIHESGRVHVRAGQEEAGPVFVPDMQGLRGEHIATVLLDRIDALEPYARSLKQTASEEDVLLPIGSNVGSARLAIYMNAAEPEFGYECLKYITLESPRLSRPLYVGFAWINQQPLGAPKEESGVVIIVGWDPLASTDVRQELLWVMGL